MMNRTNILKKGIVLIDKPAGITSFELVDQVKSRLGAKKAGHSGTLDLAVTGIMVIALDEATKAMPVLMGLDKEYEGMMKIHARIDDNNIRQACESFVGKFMQTPPRRSAVRREPREREIYDFKIMKIEDSKVFFSVRCQSGTYIRKLCSDIGERLGCVAHMVKLRRTGVGPFAVESCKKPESVTENDMIPLETALDQIDIKKIFIKKEFIGNVMNGMAIEENWVEKYDKGINKGEIIAIYLENEIIGLGIFGEKKFAKTDRLIKFNDIL